MPGTNAFDDSDGPRARARANRLVRETAHRGTLTGVLADLADHARPVVLALDNGRSHRGTITDVGLDHVVLRRDTAGGVLVALAAIASVRTGPGEAPVTGDRPLVAELTLGERLRELATERTRVLIVGADPAHALSGELRAVGRDVITLRLDGDGALAYTALDSVAEVSVVVSG